MIRCLSYPFYHFDLSYNVKLMSYLFYLPAPWHRLRTISPQGKDKTLTPSHYILFSSLGNIIFPTICQLGLTELLCFFNPQMKIIVAINYVYMWCQIGINFFPFLACFSQWKRSFYFLSEDIIRGQNLRLLHVMSLKTLFH